jgi:hypothetical protein
MSIERHGRMILKEKPKKSESDMSQSHFVHHKSHMGYPGLKPGLHGKMSANNSQKHVTASGVTIVYEFKILK